MYSRNGCLRFPFGCKMSETWSLMCIVWSLVSEVSTRNPHLLSIGCGECPPVFQVCMCCLGCVTSVYVWCALDVFLLLSWSFSVSISRSLFESSSNYLSRSLLVAFSSCQLLAFVYQKWSTAFYSVAFNKFTECPSNVC